MGLLLIFARHPSPRVLDRADDRLPARMHMDVLDRDLLLGPYLGIGSSLSKRVVNVRESLLAWARASRRPSKVCSRIIARR